VFRASADYADDLTTTLQRAGFHAEVPLSHAAHGQQAIEILVSLGKAAAGIDALAKVLAAVLARHDKKRVVLPDGTTLDGYGAAGVSKVLNALHGNGSGSAPDPGPSSGM